MSRDGNSRRLELNKVHIKRRRGQGHDVIGQWSLQWEYHDSRAAEERGLGWKYRSGVYELGCNVMKETERRRLWPRGRYIPIPGEHRLTHGTKDQEEEEEGKLLPDDRKSKKSKKN